MDPKLRTKIDTALIQRQMTVPELAKTFNLKKGAIERRRQKLTLAIPELARGTKNQKVQDEARAALKWVNSAAIETYNLAKSQKRVLRDGMGTPVVRNNPDTKLPELVYEDEPVFRAMVDSIKQMHDLARTQLEVQGEIGKVAEVRASSSGGIGGNFQLNGGNLNVLVLPKDPGVEEVQEIDILKALE